VARQAGRRALVGAERAAGDIEREVTMTDARPERPMGNPPEDEARMLARKRVKAKRDLTGHVVVYVVVNAFLVVVWWLSGQGYFWPVWVMAGWGIGLVLNVWEVYGRRPITEADIDKEMGRSPE
jgi:hypothetical protein